MKNLFENSNNCTSSSFKTSKIILTLALVAILLSSNVACQQNIQETSKTTRLLKTDALNQR